MKTKLTHFSSIHSHRSGIYLAFIHINRHDCVLAHAHIHTFRIHKVYSLFFRQNQAMIIEKLEQIEFVFEYAIIFGCICKSFMNFYRIKISKKFLEFFDKYRDNNLYVQSPSLSSSSSSLMSTVMVEPKKSKKKKEENERLVSRWRNAMKLNKWLRIVKLLWCKCLIRCTNVFQNRLIFYLDDGRIWLTCKCSWKRIGNGCDIFTLLAQLSTYWILQFRFSTWTLVFRSELADFGFRFILFIFVFLFSFRIQLTRFMVFFILLFSLLPIIIFHRFLVVFFTTNALLVAVPARWFGVAIRTVSRIQHTQYCLVTKQILPIAIFFFRLFNDCRS